MRDLRHPTYLRAILDMMPRCIDNKDEDGETVKGIYTRQLGDIIGEEAYEATRHINAQFLQATHIGPYPRECQKAWDNFRQHAIENYGLTIEMTREVWVRRLGPIANPTPTMIRNRAAEPRRPGYAETTAPQPSAT